MSNQRKICYEILYDYEKDSTFLNLLMKDRLKNVENKGIITEIVYGVVRNKLFLDKKISECSKIRLKKISLPVLVILRIAFYEMYFLDSIPDYAIINESVNLAKKYAYKSAGFVNGILRKGINKTPDNYPPNILYSFSEEMYNKIKIQYGEKTSEILKSLNEKKPVAIRINRLKTDEDTLSRKLDLIKKDGHIFITGNVNNEYFKEGLFSVMGISSQMAVEVLAPQKNEEILDCCSAPGGKTAYIGEILENTGHITAMELHPHRCTLIEENLKRLGITNTEVKNHDATEFISDYSRKFNRVLCDVPCSGWGVIGSKPDIKWQNTDINELIEIQKKILKTASNYVKTGGVLVYSTCTINKEENKDIVDDFLEKNQDFKKEEFSISIDSVEYGEDGTAQIMPSENATGFYIAKLIRQF